jgi:hypothetical protein
LGNTFCYRGKFPDLFIFLFYLLFILLAVFLTNLSSVQGTLAVTIPDEEKAKLIEVLPLLNLNIGRQANQSYL